MYICEHCEKVFEEPHTIHTTYESYYGVWSDFSSHNPLDLKVCPHCGCEEIKPYEESEEEEDVK